MMPEDRVLDIDELEDKIRDYSSDIEFCDKENLGIEMDQFLNFLEHQPISKRILERIIEDYGYINEQIPDIKRGIVISNNENFHSLIKTKVQRGALGFFVIKQLSQKERVDSNFYIETAYRIYHNRGDYDRWRYDFNDLLFKPFIHLIVDWYIKESKSSNEEDYYSRIEMDDIIRKLDDVLEKIDSNHDKIESKFEEQKELIKLLKKRDWKEMLVIKLLSIGLDPKTIKVVLKIIFNKIDIDIEFPFLSSESPLT